MEHIEKRPTGRTQGGQPERRIGRILESEVSGRRRVTLVVLWMELPTVDYYKEVRELNRRIWPHWQFQFRLRTLLLIVLSCAITVWLFGVVLPRYRLARISMALESPPSMTIKLDSRNGRPMNVSGDDLGGFSVVSGIRLKVGNAEILADRAMLWPQLDTGRNVDEFEAYLEGDVRIRTKYASIGTDSAFVRVGIRPLVSVNEFARHANISGNFEARSYAIRQLNAEREHVANTSRSTEHRIAPENADAVN